MLGQSNVIQWRCYCTWRWNDGSGVKIKIIVQSIEAGLDARSVDDKGLDECRQALSITVGSAAYFLLHNATLRVESTLLKVPLLVPKVLVYLLTTPQLYAMR